MKNEIILAIESSCDDTGAAVFDIQRGLLSNHLFSQTALHQSYGGVVPELASRTHIEKINGVVQAALDKAQVNLSDITTVAVTNRPGLPGSLLVGVCFAKGIAWAQNKKLIGIDHLEGHIFSACIEHQIPFPFLCLTASGGHTALYRVDGFGQFELLGNTVDDAAGEAFDKISKLLELGYPGGPIIEKLAQEVHFKDYFDYPRSDKKTLNFSFSGLKTAVLYDLVKRNAYDLKNKQLLDQSLELKQQVASSFLVCVKDIFKEKLDLAYKQHPDIKAVAFVGGVACNAYLKQQLSQWADTKQLSLFTPRPSYCTDNAAMIAFVAQYKIQQGIFSDLTLDILV